MPTQSAYTSLDLIAPTFSEALAKDLPVLFCYIGWARLYDGTETIRGNHSYLQANPTENAEGHAFIRDDQGHYSAGIGRGEVDALDGFHVVFVAKQPSTQVRVVVGVYADAHLHRPEGIAAPVYDEWQFATTRWAVLFPPEDRPEFQKGQWPGSSGVRRWACETDGTKWPRLLELFLQIRDQLLKGIEEELSEDWLTQGAEFEDISGAMEGSLRSRYVRHRHREQKFRQTKINSVLRSRGGRLRCEVPNCGFDFVERYGAIGEGFAHVHHLTPLSEFEKSGRKVHLKDLAIVCPNCHAMIHRGGGCRSLEELLPTHVDAHQ
ncbi:MAG TPA: HNH endonuclease [Holophagaceae bacterium]|nr:HNH endonuclease [Holophagaceae bacterium]